MQKNKTKIDIKPLLGLCKYLEWKCKFLVSQNIMSKTTIIILNEHKLHFDLLFLVNKSWLCIIKMSMWTFALHELCMSQLCETSFIKTTQCSHAHNNKIKWFLIIYIICISFFHFLIKTNWTSQEADKNIFTVYNLIFKTFYLAF